MSAQRAAGKPRRAGQPIVVLASLLALWIGGRSLLWESPFPAALREVGLPAVLAEAIAPPLIKQIISAADTSTGGVSVTGKNTPKLAVIANMPTLRHAFFSQPTYQSTDQPRDQSGRQPMMLASHQLMWMSGLSNAPVAPEIAALLKSAAAPANPSMLGGNPQTSSFNKRWSADGWLFVRPQSTRAIRNVNAGPIPATYGASQAGAVLRYRLAPSSKNDPFVYIRASTALVEAGDSEAAAGISARPLASVPVSAHAEMRASRIAGRTVIRPAAFVVTQLKPQKLPLSSHITAYGQAGYVGGDFATPFADGQARLDREVVKYDLAKLRVGAGVWGGAQKGAARLDLGPTASADITLGESSARLAVDYRHRVAGDAEPQSGIAITLSTGF